MKSISNIKIDSSSEQLQRISNLHRHNSKLAKCSEHYSARSEVFFKTSDSIFKKSQIPDHNRLLSLRSSPTMHTLIYGQGVKVSLEIPRQPFQRQQKLWNEGNRRYRKDSKSFNTKSVQLLTNKSTKHTLSLDSSKLPNLSHNKPTIEPLEPSYDIHLIHSVHTSPHRLDLTKALKLENKISHAETSSIKCLKAHIHESTLKYNQLKSDLRSVCGIDADAYFASRKARWQKEQFLSKNDNREYEAKEMKKILDQWKQEMKNWVYN